MWGEDSDNKLDKSIFNTWKLGWIPTTTKPPSVPFSDLSLQQRQILQTIKTHVRQPPNVQISNPLLMLIAGSAGVGKSVLCHHIKYLLDKHVMQDPNFSFLMCAYTGVAAFNIRGVTLHSGLGLPIPVKEENLEDYIRNINIRSKKASPLGARNFYVIDQILRKYDAKNTESPFAARSVCILGDIFQLGPIRDRPLFDPFTKRVYAFYAHGHYLYKLFKQVFVLKNTFHHKGQSQDQTNFRQFLGRIRRNETTESDVEYLRKRLKCSLSEEEQKKFRTSLYIFPRRWQVAEHNEKMLRKNYKDEEIASIPNGFEILNIAIGCPVMLLYNIMTPWGLCNGSCGFVRDIIFNKYESTTMPLCILVDFLQYEGLHYYETKRGTRGIPVFRYYDHDELNRIDHQAFEVYPLRLCYGLTIHKVMALTLDSVAICLSSKENSPGMDYVALSRVRRFEDIMILDYWIYPDRLKYDGEKSKLQRYEEQRLISLEGESTRSGIMQYTCNKPLGFRN